MKVSIITACYNREKTISTAIESVLNQSYNNIEYLVIDGDSKDDTLKVIKQYEKNIDVIISEEDTGIYNALNKGIKNCTGDIVGILHSDDLYYNNDIIKQVVEVFETTNADIVYANGMYSDEKDLNVIKRIYKSNVFKSYFLYFGWIPLHTTIYVRKGIFDKYGLYREDFKVAADYEISLRWFKNNSLKKVFLNKWVVIMRLGGVSTNIKLQKLKSTEDLKIIMEYNLLGKFTLLFKILRKVPQYIFPKLLKYK